MSSAFISYSRNTATLYYCKKKETKKITSNKNKRPKNNNLYIQKQNTRKPVYNMQITKTKQ